MREALHWLLWKDLPPLKPGGKRRKVPYYVTGIRRHGTLDSPADIARLTSCEDACTALTQSQGYAGLGFALGRGWQGCDLDGCRDPVTGKLEAWATAIIERAATYAEISPSGKGVHLLGYDMDEPALKALGANGSGVEFYAAGRFFTFTGRVLEGFTAPVRSLAPVYGLAERRWLDAGEVAVRRQTQGLLPSTGGSIEWPGFALELSAKLHHVPPGRPRERWLAISMGIHHASGGSEAGFKFWHDWSAKATDGSYTGEADLRKQWAGFDARHAKPVTWGTVKMYLDQYQPKPVVMDPDALVNWLRAWRPYDPAAVAPVEFYVDGLIERRRSVGLVAPGGTGKTTALLMLGIATALGREWFDMRVKAGSFVLLSLDDLQEDLEGALEAVMQALKLKEDERAIVRARVRLYSLLAFTEAVPGFAVEERGAIVETALKAWLIRGLEGIVDLRCIVLDTMRQFAGGDTNNGRVMSIATRAVTALAVARDCACIVPHHMTKQGARDGDALDQYAGTGSAAFGDNLRVILVLYKANAEELERAVEVPALARSLLADPDTEVIKLVDTRGSLRRKAVAPIWIARQGYHLWRINGRTYTPQERQQADIERVVMAVKNGATSVEKVRAIIKVGKARAEQLVAEAIASDRLSKTGKTKGLSFVR